MKVTASGISVTIDGNPLLSDVTLTAQAGTVGGKVIGHAATASHPLCPLGDIGLVNLQRHRPGQRQVVIIVGGARASRNRDPAPPQFPVPIPG